MFHDKHRTTWHGTTHRDDGLTAAARPAVSGDDALEGICRARWVTSAASRSRRSRIIAVRFVRFSPGWPGALVPGPRPRSTTCPRTWRVADCHRHGNQVFHKS